MSKERRGFFFWGGGGGIGFAGLDGRHESLEMYGSRLVLEIAGENFALILDSQNLSFETRNNLGPIFNPRPLRTTRRGKNDASLSKPPEFFNPKAFDPSLGNLG